MNLLSRRQFCQTGALGALAVPFGGSRGSDAAAGSARVINIRERGAKADGSNCASVINRAIEDGEGSPDPRLSGAAGTPPDAGQPRNLNE